MAKKLSDQERINEYVNKRMLGQVLKQKLFEFTLIPLAIAAFGFISYWAGRLLYFIFKLSAEEGVILYIIPGMLIVFILAAIIVSNINYARSHLEEMAREDLGIEEGVETYW